MTEAQELIAELEKSLLMLDNDQENKDGIASVFRTMHTLKGSASMFGFETLSSLTHQIETIYDQIRNGKRNLNNNILSVTLLSVDHLKKLLEDAELSNDSLRKSHEALIIKLEGIANDESEENSTLQHNKENQSITKESTYYILFNPKPDILQNGTNTLYLLDDLLSLGEGITLPFFNQILSFIDIKPDTSYIGFETVLYTNVTLDQIREVFIFVEGNCELKIKKVGEGNLIIKNLEFENLCRNHRLNKQTGENKIFSALMETPRNLTKVISETAANVKATSNVRVSSFRLDELMNLVSELVTTQAGLSLLAENSSYPELITVAENIEKITRRLRDNAFTMSLIPIESLVVRYQRLVRDLSRELKKDVVVHTEGTETEIEKSIIERLTDPLLHILRNALDHGIESEEVRLRLGKPKQGTLVLKSYYSGANVVIEISDDGAGIDPEKLRKSAEEKGIIALNAILSKKELLNLIFLPGFSTAESVTGISGRGVGMDVVRRKIAEINGEIEVESNVNKGTKVTIKLPPSLSIIDGLLVKAYDTRFIIPLSAVDQIFGITQNQINRSYNNLIVLAGEAIPFYSIREEFNYERIDNENEIQQAVIVRYENVRIALILDKVIGEYQAVLKPLGKIYRNQESISGASILGDGDIALVLDTNKFIKLSTVFENKD
jgi:two-component system chemotaxis sensor kinase CheA